MLGWKHWGTGVAESGLYFVEYETSEQYDEWQLLLEAIRVAEAEQKAGVAKTVSNEAELAAHLGSLKR